MGRSLAAIFWRWSQSPGSDDNVDDHIFDEHKEDVIMMPSCVMIMLVFMMMMLRAI